MATTKQKTMRNEKSILAPEERGVFKVSGYRGRGKSYFLSQMENPKLTAFFDFEKKGEGIDSQLDFGLYLPVTELAANSGVGVWDEFVKGINSIESGQYTHAILDNTAPLETAMRAEAARNADVYAKQFGMDAGNIRANRYGGQSGVVNYLISEKICNVLWGKGIQLISVTSHIKPRWSGGVQVPNSYNIKGADRWDELSILTLIMIPGDHPPVPSALVMKEQLGQIEFDEKSGEFTVTRRLPYKLTTATPAAIIKYLKSPANLDDPRPGEVPDEEEIAPFRDKLSREQMSIVLAEIENEKSRSIAPFSPAKIEDQPLSEEEKSMDIPSLARARGLSIPAAKKLLDEAANK